MGQKLKLFLRKRYNWRISWSKWRSGHIGKKDIQPLFWSPLLDHLLLCSCFTIIILSQLLNPLGVPARRGRRHIHEDHLFLLHVVLILLHFFRPFSVFFISYFLMAGQPSDSSPLIPPAPISDPSEIDLEAGQGEQIQCRICLETDGNLFLLCFSVFARFRLFSDGWWGLFSFGNVRHFSSGKFVDEANLLCFLCNQWLNVAFQAKFFGPQNHNIPNLRCVFFQYHQA